MGNKNEKLKKGALHNFLPFNDPRNSDHQQINAKPWFIFEKESLKNLKSKYSMISLFSGCGGLDLGFYFAGFKILWANDIDKNACLTYDKNIDSIEEGNIAEIGFPDIEHSPDVLAAGFPCQSFSNAGSRKGVNDNRGALYKIALKAVANYKPRIVVFENVRGLMSVKDGDKLVIQNICEYLAEHGYKTYIRLLDSSKYRVPQRRLRLFIVSVQRNLDNGSFSFPYEDNSSFGLSLGETISDIPEDVPNKNEFLQLNPQALKIGAMVPEGGSWKDIPYHLLPDRLKRVRDNMKRYRWPNFYRRFARHEIAGTVTAAFKPENAGVWHPTENRVLSVREIARIQSFPDWFIFHGKSIKSKYQQIGNAVPPRLAYELGCHVFKYLEKETLEGINNFLPFKEFIKYGNPLRPSDPGICFLDY